MMLPLRIRKAQVALTDGRLEEAYQQAIRDDVRDHRKGQRLITRLQQAYEKRARVHLTGGNAMAAVADADKAYRLGGNQPGVVALREEAREQLNSSEREKRVRSQKLAAARKCLAGGDYSLGAKICQDVNDGNTVAGLMQDAEFNRRIVDSAVERGRKALSLKKCEEALDALEEAKRLQPSQPDVKDLERAVLQGVTQQIRDRVSIGRLDQADLLMQRLRKHGEANTELQELARVITQCRSVSITARNVDVAEMVANLKSLKHIIPDARWLNDAIKDAEAVARGMESLRTGPLGSLLPLAATQSTFIRANQPKRNNVQGASPMRVFEATPVIPSKFLIHLDGAGSFLVVRNPCVTIGSPSRSQRVDVPLQGQLGSGAMTIERMDDDYFFTAVEPVSINSKPTASKLLIDKDQVRLGRRGSMHFALPNAASTSATLDFAGIRLASGNARRVILMDDAIVIGPQSSAHIQSLAMERAMVMHWRDGELQLRPLSRSVDTSSVAIALDQPHDIDGLSLVVTEASDMVS